MVWAQGGPRPRGEFPRVLGQGPRLGRAGGLYISVYNANNHDGGQLIEAASVTQSAPSYVLALRVAFGHTQS